MKPAKPPLPTARNLPFQAAGSQTSNLTSGLISPITRQKAGKAIGDGPAGDSGTRGDPLHALIALEKAMMPAGNAQNVDAMTFLEHQVKKRLGEFDMQGKATRAYESGDLANALVYYELLQDFERTDAIWNGKSDEYFK